MRAPRQIIGCQDPPRVRPPVQMARRASAVGGATALESGSCRRTAGARGGVAHRRAVTGNRATRRAFAGARGRTRKDGVASDESPRSQKSATAPTSSVATRVKRPRGKRAIRQSTCCSRKDPKPTSQEYLDAFAGRDLRIVPSCDCERAESAGRVAADDFTEDLDNFIVADCAKRTLGDEDRGHLDKLWREISRIRRTLSGARGL